MYILLISLILRFKEKRSQVVGTGKSGMVPVRFSKILVPIFTQEQKIKKTRSYLGTRGSMYHELAIREKLIPFRVMMEHPQIRQLLYIYYNR